MRIIRQTDVQIISVGNIGVCNAVGKKNIKDKKMTGKSHLKSQNNEAVG